MSDLPPKKTSPDHNFDEELVLTFLSKYHSLEQALVRAGFTRAGSTPGNARPDWEQFARHIEGKFDPESAPELAGAVGYLLADPEKDKLRWERLQASLPGDRSSPQSDIVWLSELIQGIRNRLLHWLNFGEEAWDDDPGIVAALFIVDAWSVIDPKVKSLLGRVQ